MADLFNYYEGFALVVSETTHAQLCEMFSELDLRSMYRDADSWLLTCAPKRKPRNYKRFLLNWARKARKQYERETRKEQSIRAELYAGESKHEREERTKREANQRL